MSFPESDPAARYAERLREARERIAAMDCPPWCAANHATGVVVHARCISELLWPHASVAVELVCHAKGDCVELGHFADERAPAIAHLTAGEARMVRDALDKALSYLEAA